MAKSITLREFEFLQSRSQEAPRFIKPETFEALERFVLDNEHIAQYLKITTKKGYGKVLQAQNFVGVIQTKDGTTIEILPKIQNVDEQTSKEILLKMLKTLRKSPFKNLNLAHLQSKKIPLLEVFISMFLDELSQLIQKGLKSDYIPKEENQKYLKGKLKLNEQIKQNFIHKERFFVAYEEFLSDRVENRLIKTTLEYLYKRSHLNANQQRIREFLFVFDEIQTSSNIKTDFQKVNLNRTTKQYEQVLLWCKTFLLENSFSPYTGKDIAFALLFDMNLLFESYVYKYLKLSHSHETITPQDKKHFLAYERDSGRFRLKPDIVIDDGKMIIDTKWKLLSEEKAYNGVAQSDMYQLYAYGTKYEKCDNLYLIYPYDGVEIMSSYDYFQKDKSLKLDILFFDLQKNQLRGEVL